VAATGVTACVQAVPERELPDQRHALKPIASRASVQQPNDDPHWNGFFSFQKLPRGHLLTEQSATENHSQHLDAPLGDAIPKLQ
jgi:hypothetical protein